MFYVISSSEDDVPRKDVVLQFRLLRRLHGRKGGWLRNWRKRVCLQAYSLVISGNKLDVLSVTVKNTSDDYFYGKTPLPTPAPTPIPQIHLDLDVRVRRCNDSSKIVTVVVVAISELQRTRVLYCVPILYSTS